MAAMGVSDSKLHASPTMADTKQGPNGKVDVVEESMEYILKKYLLLLATLVATVTYAAGLNLPGGSWPEDAPGGQVAGDSILRETNFRRYIVFYVFNAISFAASLVVGLLLLVLREGTPLYLLRLMQTVMVVDLLGLVGAYAAGSSHDGFTTACAATVLVSAVATYAAVSSLASLAVWLNPDLRHARTDSRTPGPDEAALTSAAAAEAAEEEAAKAAREESEREILLVLAIFAATIAYVAGLNPPGGFWRSAEEGHHAAGDPVLQGLHPVRYRAFFFFNTTAFAASLLAIMLVVDHKKFNLWNFRVPIRYVTLYGLILTALLGLGIAYAAGSCRDSRHTIYVLSLVALVVACIFLPRLLLDNRRDERKKYEDLGKTRECIQLLATLAVTIAYQAGVDPPGGVWSENGPGHSVGDPILLTTHPGRFKVFFYFNSVAFVASLVIMAMLQKSSLIRHHVLEKAMILDLFALIGAYAAGSCRDTSMSIYTVAMAGAVLIYVVIHIVFFDHNGNGGDHQELDKYREVLLLLAILAATLTYQAGLTPPGGFWESDDKFGHRAGFPVLQDKYPRRYKAFFYCNAASFMASVALILLLLNPNLYRPGIRCYALYVCMVAGMFGLMAAYAAGSSLHLKTSIIALTLVGAVFVAVVCLAIRLYRASKHSDTGKKHKEDQQRKESDTAKTPDQQTKKKEDGMMQEANMGHQAKKEPGTVETPDQSEKNESDKAETPDQLKNEDDMMQEYLMLVGIIGASVTYLTGLKPPGGMWQNDDNGHSAGNPVLHETNKHRYNAFFYSNSTAFVASIVVMALLLSRMMSQLHSKLHLPLWPMHTAMFLGMVALLIAYAAGSARDQCTSWKVIVLLVPIVAFVMCLFAFYTEKGEEGDKEGAEGDKEGDQGAEGETESAKEQKGAKGAAGSRDATASNHNA